MDCMITLKTGLLITQAYSNNLYHLQECEQQYKADRKKWLEEKMMLITQAKAENLRNRDEKIRRRQRVLFKAIK